MMPGNPEVNKKCAFVPFSYFPPFYPADLFTGTLITVRTFEAYSGRQVIRDFQHYLLVVSSGRPFLAKNYESPEAR
jgi:hypothetical protein